MIDVVILGASGYGGGELLRLLCQHPQVRSIAALSRQYAGKPIHAAHPHLRGLVPLSFVSEYDWTDLRNSDSPVVFAAMPHGEFARQYASLEEAWAEAGLLDRLAVIDLSGDFRLKEAAAFEAAYGFAHPCPQALEQFTYGLSEWNGAAIAASKRIANPGCFATAIQLGLLPLKALDLACPSWVAISAITGSSGSGASASETTHHPTRAQDFRAYKVLQHQHESEIRCSLQSHGAGIDFALVPHSAPLVRGIFATLTFPSMATTGEIRAAFDSAYREAFFVRLVETTPRIAAVAGSNFTDIAVGARNGNATVLVALDNLLKGMAGQAVQNLNLMLGIDATTGLRAAAAFP